MSRLNIKENLYKGKTTSLSTMKDRESDKNRQMRKQSRRPDMELYKPGMGLHNKNSQKSNSNINSTNDASCNHTTSDILSRENYYTSLTSHVTQEENWDSNLIPLEELENLYISTKTFSQANELKMQSTNIPDQGTKEGEKMKTNDSETKQEIPISSSYPPPPSTPVLGSYYSNHLQQDTQNQRMKRLVKKNVRSIRQLERKLSSYLAQGFNRCDMNSVGMCRWRLRLKYENIILADPHYSAEQNIEQSLWKTVFYEVVEALRKQMDEDPEKKEDAEQALIKCCDEGSIFYDNLLEKQHEIFGLTLERYLDYVGKKPQHISESVRPVVASMDKTYSYLGELRRYREQASGKSK